MRLKYPTCTEEGYTGDDVCTVCGMVFTYGTTIPTIDHTQGHVRLKYPTCTEEGYTGDDACTVCGLVFTYGTAIPASGHTWDSGTVTSPVACNSYGVRTFHCIICGGTKTEPAATQYAAHTPALRNVSAPTCTGTGYTGDYICTVCGVKTQSGTTIPASGHRWNAGAVTAPVTCISLGIKTFTCTVCGATRTEDAAADYGPHKTVIEMAKPATCNEAGFTGLEKCTVCGKYLSYGQQIPRLEHVPTQKNAKAATCLETGYTGDRVCSLCGVMLSAGSVTPKSGHTILAGDAPAGSHHAAVAATKDRFGNVEYWQCAVCRMCFSSPSASSSSLIGPESATLVAHASYAAWGIVCDGITWTLDNAGLLAISGAGAMPDFGFASYPWSDVSDSIRSVSISVGITSIGEYAFSDCDALRSITIPGSVASIGDFAFDGCDNLTGVTIGSGVKTIGRGAFQYCSALSGVAIPGSVTSIGCNAFQYCFGLSRITIPGSVTAISDYAFYNCSRLASVTISDGVISIGAYAFYCCENLYSMSIPASVGFVGDYAFSGTPWEASMGEFSIINGYLTAYRGPGGRVVIPNGVKAINGLVFSGRDNVTSVVIPDGVTSIGEMCFQHCLALDYVTIPASVARIGSSAFNDCPKLTSAGPIGSGCGIEFGWKYQIPTRAFFNCGSLRSVTLPDTLTAIDAEAFYNTSLTQVVFPKGLRYIGEDAFGWSTTLEMTFTGPAFSGHNAFSGLSGTVYYPGAGAGWTAEVISGFGGNMKWIAVLSDDTVTLTGTENEPLGGVDLIVEKLSAPLAQSALSSRGLRRALGFDITLADSAGHAVQPAGSITVRLNVPAGYVPSLCRVYYQQPNGTLTDMNARFVAGKLTFETTHFSTYIIAQERVSNIPRGDANADGVCGIADAMTVVQAQVGLFTMDAEDITSCDMNGDGVVDLADALAIARMTLTG